MSYHEKPIFEMTREERIAWRHDMRRTQKRMTLPPTRETKAISWGMGISFGIVFLGYVLRLSGLWGGF